MPPCAWQDAVRKANVVAVGNVTILKLTRDVFHAQLGDLEGLVAENFKRKVLALSPTLALALALILLLDGAALLAMAVLTCTCTCGCSVLAVAAPTMAVLTRCSRA